jgi:hypothetical protein
MRDDYSHLTFVLDRSDSMETVKGATIEGFNSLLRQQKAIPGIKATATLIQFNDVYRVDYSFMNLKDVPELNNDSYVTGNTTALLDAIGRGIKETGDALKKLPEAERPSKVLFVIQTDGFENASREYTRRRVFDMITHQKEKYLWEFIFIGANQDAIATGATLGINAKSSMSYTANNTRAALVALGDI